MKSLQQAIEDARATYSSANPLSLAADKEAERSLPGGNTRSVLYFEPFPLTMVAGEGAELVDLDGHRYVDFVGEYSAGLFGHSDETIKAAVQEALNTGVVLGAPTRYERELAGLLCARIPSVEQIRFCNSGTEANIMSLASARALTGRRKVLVFGGAYHGGVIKFPAGGSPLNIPYEFILAEYNDIDGTVERIDRAGGELAAVIVEPILGAGGNIPGSREFMEMLRRKTREVGALLIFDEVKTSRLGPAGLQGLLGIEPDMTTLGKYIGGGLPTGAFGGSAEVMEHFNPKHKGTWNHAGTFNNNICSMAAGCAAMSRIYTPQCATEFFERSEAFRISLNEMFAERAVPMHCNGMGSIFAIHFSPRPVRRTADITAGCLSLRPLLHMEMLLDGVLLCGRGDMFLSLPMTETHLSKARLALEKFIDRYKPLIIAVLEQAQRDSAVCYTGGDPAEPIQLTSPRRNAMGCFNSTVVNAPADEVWAAMRKFHDMSWCPNVIQGLEPQGDPELAGAKRTLNGVFRETLISIDDAERICRYSIDDGPEALSSENMTGYVGQYQVFPVTADNTAFVLWTSTWKSSGGGVAEFCNPVYQALLADLKRTFDPA